MTGPELTQWRSEMRLSKREAASLLGISPETIAVYEAGKRRDGKPVRDIPAYIPLACAALYHRLSPWPKG
jgi:predicted transcriptional regulator